MLISFNHRLVILAMPKCASTALEQALECEMDLVLRGHPAIKHTRFREYEQFIQPYLARLTNETFEVVSAFREPEDWLHSWWRYRRRDGMKKSANSTRNMTFEEFVQLHLDGERRPADVGRQSRIISTRGKQIGVDTLFRYDRMPQMVRYLGERLGLEIKLERVNVSPSAPWFGSKLVGAQRARLQSELARDYEIYETVAR